MILTHKNNTQKTTVEDQIKRDQLKHCRERCDQDQSQFSVDRTRLLKLGWTGNQMGGWGAMVSLFVLQTGNNSSSSHLLFQKKGLDSASPSPGIKKKHRPRWRHLSSSSVGRINLKIKKEIERHGPGKRIQLREGLEVSSKCKWGTQNHIKTLTSHAKKGTKTTALPTWSCCWVEILSSDHFFVEFRTSI